jgi:hypothetical protein
MFVWGVFWSLSMRLLVILFAVMVAGCATQVTDSRQALGGVYDRKLTESRYLISAKINGFTGVGALKPMILQRAHKIGVAGAYSTFEIESVKVGISRGADSSVVVSYSHESRAPIAGSRYQVDPGLIPAYKQELTEKEKAGLAQLKSFSKRDAVFSLLAITPAFLDAVSSDLNAMDGLTTSYLAPGFQKIDAYVWVVPSLGAKPLSSLVSLSYEFKPGVSYVMAGEYRDGQLIYWLEEELTKRKVVADMLARPQSR